MSGHTKHFTYDNTKTEVTSLALSFYSGLFAYNGWNYLNFIIEELKDPIKNLPRAIAISCTLVTVVYVATNVAFYTVLSPDEVLGSEAVAVILPLWKWLIVCYLSFAECSTLKDYRTNRKLFYAGACEGQMPEILTMIQINRLTPTPAVLCMVDFAWRDCSDDRWATRNYFEAVLSMMYLTVSDILALINYVGFATWLSIGVSVLCLPVLRWTQPNLARPIKVSLFWPFLYIVCSLFVTIVPMIASPVETGIGCLMIFSSVPVYLVFIAWKNKPIFFQKFVVIVTQLLQKIMLVVGKQTPAKV